MSTLASIRGLSRTLMKVDPNGKMINDAAMTVFINTSIDKIQRDFSYNLPENLSSGTLALVGGTQEYTLPTDFAKFSLVMLDKRPLGPTTRNLILRKYGEFPTGPATEYYLERDVVGINPIPTTSGAINYEYSRKFPLLADDEDVSELSADFDDATAKYTAYQAFASIPRYAAEAQEKLNDYTMSIMLLKQKYLLGETLYNIVR